MKKLFGILTLGLASISMLWPLPAGAASGKLYLSPGSAKIIKGNIITIGVRENSGSTKINAVQANLTYTSSKLDFLGITSSSTFGVVAQNSGGGGQVKIGRGAFKAVSGDHLVASIRFKALSSSGSASIKFASGSGMAGVGGSMTISTRDGSYSFKSATTSPKPAPAPTHPTSPAPATPSTPSKDTTPPKIGNVSVADVTRTSAVIHWTTSEPATSEVRYGTDSNYGLAASSDNKVTAHKITIKDPSIQPGTTYHFVVKSVDTAGNGSSSDDGTFVTQGAVLVVTVVNQKNKPVEGAEVSVAGQSAKTDKAGIATLYSLSSGSQTVKVTYQGKVVSKDVAIAKDASIDKPQSTTVQVHTTSSAAIWLTLLAVIGLAGLAWYLYGGRTEDDIDDDIGGDNPKPGNSEELSKELHASLLDDMKKPPASPAKVNPPASAAKVTPKTPPKAPPPPAPPVA